MTPNMHGPEKGKIEGILAITNTQPTEVRLTLEPWADEHVMAPGKTVEVSYSGPSGGRMEIELKPGEVILYGWEGSVLSVRDGGNPS